MNVLLRTAGLLKRKNATFVFSPYGSGFPYHLPEKGYSFAPGTIKLVHTIVL